MLKPVILSVALLAGFGLVNNVNDLNKGDRPKESWLLEKMPEDVIGYKVIPYSGNPKITYRMDDQTYEELDPIGIAAQKLQNGNQRFDVVVIAGNQMESFHDQRWCFSAQGWNILETQEVRLNTEKRGEVPATLVRIEREGIPATWAMFIFKGPKSFHASTPPAAKDFFWNDLMSGKRSIGYSYRFIAEWGSALPEQVVQFASQYLDATYNSSGGLF